MLGLYVHYLSYFVLTLHRKRISTSSSTYIPSALWSLVVTSHISRFHTQKFRDLHTYFTRVSLVDLRTNSCYIFNLFVFLTEIQCVYCAVRTESSTLLSFSSKFWALHFLGHYTEWLKRFCAPDDYNTEVRCTETFWSPCITEETAPISWH